MNRHEYRQRQFRAHLAVAGSAVVLGMAAGYKHLPVLAFINAAIFGANIGMAWMVRP